MVFYLAKKVKDDRTRNWNLIVYPDSAPDNWRDILDDHHFQWVESPLHDKDLNPTGETKKAHWHVTLLFEGNKSFEQILELTKPLNCALPVKCMSASSSIRYMAHLDNPEKAQYNKDLIVAHGGVDLSSYLAPRSSERYITIRQMQRYIKEKGITEYGDFLDYAAEERFDDWYPLLCDSCSYVIRSYINSQRFKKMRSLGVSKEYIDPESGELVNIKSK